LIGKIRTYPDDGSTDTLRRNSYITKRAIKTSVQTSAFGWSTFPYSKGAKIPCRNI
jgi:hypothetical protein